MVVVVEVAAVAEDGVEAGEEVAEAEAAGIVMGTGGQSGLVSSHPTHPQQLRRHPRLQQLQLQHPRPLSPPRLAQGE